MMVFREEVRVNGLKKVFNKEMWLYYLLGFLCFGSIVKYSLDKVVGHGGNMLSMIPAIIIFLLSVALLKLPIKKEYQYMVILFLMGVIYLFSTKVVPDEGSHFVRAYEISEGKFVTTVTDKGGFDYLPEDLLGHVWDGKELGDIKIKWVFVAAATYFPICFFPQSVMISLLRVFTGSIKILFFGARFANFFVAFLIECVALKKIPFGKEVLFTIMILPMTLQQMGSISPDAMTNAVAFLIVAYTLYIKDKKEITKLDYGVLLCSIVVISACKNIYFIVGLYVLTIPTFFWGKGLKAYMKKVLLILPALIVDGVWMRQASRYLFDILPGMDVQNQTTYSITHPFFFFKVLVQTLMEKGGSYIDMMLGMHLGSLDIHLPGVCGRLLLIIITVIVVFSAMGDEFDVSFSDCLFEFGIFLCGYAVISFSLYVVWTTYRNWIIDGVQGRYLLPFFMFLILPIMRLIKNKIGKIKVYIDKSVLVMLVLYVNIIAIVCVKSFYL